MTEIYKGKWIHSLKYIGDRIIASVFDERERVVYVSQPYLKWKDAVTDCKNYIDEKLEGHSLDEMLTKSYGKKGSPKRELAEERINAIANNLVISNTLKAVREGTGKTQSQVAKSMRVDASVVSKIELNFKTTQLNTLVRYAKALKAKGVSIVFDFGNDDKDTLKLKI